LLADLHAQGVITDGEYETGKADALGKVAALSPTGPAGLY
jgi:hypothetical protein